MERRIIGFYESLFLTVMAQGLRKSGLYENREKATEVEVRKTFPVYGDPQDRTVSSGRDRPLPYELRARVNRWRTKLVHEDG